MVTRVNYVKQVTLITIKKTVILITMKKILYVKHIFLLIFCLVRTPFLSWDIRFEKRKARKKVLNEELMPVAWHSNRWWN